MRKFRKAFRRLPDPRADNATARSAGGAVHRVGGNAVRSGSRARTWQSSDSRRRSCCGSSFAWSMASRVTIHSAGCFVSSSRKPSSSHSVASWRPLPRPMVSSLPGWWPSTARPCAGPTNAVERPPRCTLVNVFAVEARMALAQQKASGRNETAGALEVLDLLSFEGCIVTADALHCHPRVCGGRARARRRLCSGDQGQPRALVHRGYATVCAIGQAQYQPSRSTVPPTIAAKRGGRPSCAIPAWLASTAFQVPLRWGASPRADACGVSAPMRPSCVTISCPNTSLPSGCSTSPAVIGVSRTGFIGCSTSILPRTPTARDRTMLPRTSPFCAGSPSTSCELTQIEPPCAAKSSALAGTMPSSWKPSAICDSPVF